MNAQWRLMAFMFAGLALGVAPVSDANAYKVLVAKKDCRTLGPNEGAAGGSSDPLKEYKCTTKHVKAGTAALDGGHVVETVQVCCWYHYRYTTGRGRR